MTDATRNLLEQHFDTAFAAPDGVAKLRELILTLAMQSKLVEQDPNDPPASELLKEIEAEKQRLVKAGKIKKPKPLPEVSPEEVTHEIPASWAWVRFGDIAQHNSGKTLDKGRNTGEPRDYITTSNLYWGRFELDNVRQMLIRDDELEKCTARKNDLLICEGGEAGRAAVWHFDSEVCFQNHVHRARFYRDIDPYFAYRFFEKLNTTGEINQHRKGVGISNMSSKALASIVFPLPPLPEQHRIVARIDQLMARCDALEKLRKEREEKRLAVHAAAIKQLLDGPDGTAWDFIKQHFGELYTVKENVAELRKAILQLAVMGRLVPQNPNDPPASELLKEIEAEKQRLVKAGKIKQPKPLLTIKPDELPDELPQGWEWVRMGDIGIWKSGSTPSRSNASFYGGDIPWVKSGEVKQGRIKFTEETITQMALDKCPLQINEKGSVLVAMYGANIGEVGILEIEAATNQAVCACKTYTSFDENYLLYLITSLKPYFISQGAGAAQPNISREKIVATIFPLPPLPEQHRIVACIDQLMALCDTLDQQIDAASGKQTELLNAVMAQV